ncbi:hypothetical protein J41TS12_11070 [Paenibacillus antibioticophila]|uniref:Uncharacterized protein n=1 Tax=Paenibacillus antibioticophila TaxID=1274374 RepID=A0A919XNF3_9BACL|nr:hypothetical protein [Paenibacillus antibioticophila]GIO36246.1 hypothetical protein J41TS12_11070 [Paenibacillus antibioticophila]
MKKQEIFERLLRLPAEIASAEDAVLEAHGQLVQAKEALQRKEDDVLLGNGIDGKNAEIRAAQMRQHTELEREDLSEAEMKLKNAAVRLGKLKDELRALQAAASLLQGVA